MSESISVGYVLIPFTVTDPKGRVVKNLRASDVTLLIDGAPVRTDFFHRAVDAPVSFTILLDGSGSMALAGKLEGATSAIRELLNEPIEGDDYALFVFARGAVTEVVPFTTDGSAILRAVESVRPFGRTAFFDALAAIPEKTLLGRNGSRAIILLTDGIDNASSLDEASVQGMLEGIEVPVYPLGLRSLQAVTQQRTRSAESLVDIELLGRIARASGGRVAIADRPETLKAAIAQITNDLRSQYLIGFSPTGQGPVRYRRIEVALAGDDRLVRARAGYRGTEPPRLPSNRSGKEGKKGK
ncbi:MAG TPA: VWA domain-containing protein [Thermoanaerobaculia bacterium]|nr:VWA domain-containing protein [Thermoanaerobaculia bacterium]